MLRLKGLKKEEKIKKRNVQIDLGIRELIND